MSRSFVQDNTPIPAGHFKRPSGGGGRGGGSFPTGGTPNTALNLTTPAAGMLGRPVNNVPQASVGTPSNDGRAFLAQTTPLGQQGRGGGGMPAEALQNIRRFMPGQTTPARMPHTTPSFNSHDMGRSEQGVPAFAGFGDKGDPFTRGITPTSKSQSGLMFTGFDARPTKFDSQASLGSSTGSGDPRTPNSLFSDGTQTQTSPFLMDAFMAANEAPDTKQTGEGDVVNATIPYAHVLRPVNRDPNLQPREYNGMVMLVFRGVEAVATMAFNGKSDNAQLDSEPGYGLRAISRSDADRSRFTEMNITLFNYVKASTEVRPGPGYNERKALLQLVDEWGVHGVAINDWGGRKRRRNGVSDRGNQSGFERGVNTCVQGHTSCLNLWGDKAGDGEYRLYLLAVRVMRKELAKLVGENFNIFDGLPTAASEDAAYRVTPETGVYTVQSEGLHPAPFQLVPYAHRGSSPLPDDVLEYSNGLDDKVYRGAAILVGHSHYPLGNLRAQYITNARLDVVTNGLTRTVRASTEDSATKIEQAQKAYRRLRMLQNLSIANDAQAQINAGQIMMFVNVHTEIDP